MGAEAGAPAEHLNNMLKAYIVKDVKENLKDHITVVPLEDRFRILTSLIDGHKRTALHYAAIRGHTDIIDGIFDSATENQKSELSLRRDKYGNTATAHAAFHGHTETIQYMLNILPADRRYEMFKETSNGGQSSLHIAASKGQTDVIKTIFDSATKEQKTELSMHRDMYGNTATALAAFHGHVDTVRYILNILQPATIYEMLNEMSNGGKSILHIAASKGHTDVIKTIVDSATEEQIIELSVHRDIDGNAATDLAAFHGHAETVRSILDILHPNRRYEMLKEMSNAGQSILHIAASKGQTDVIKAVSESVTEDQRFELSMRQNMYGYTASALAAFHGHTETVRYMLDILQQDSRYEVLKEKNEDGKSSLHIAASKGKTDVIKTIFESVTDEQMHDLLMLQDSNGDTAIISAAFDGHANTARYLLHAVNSDTRYEMLKVTNLKERTALHIAASEGDTTFLQTITDSLSIDEIHQTITDSLSIDKIHHLLMQQENDGNTAIALASIRGHTTTVEFILNCIQDSDKKYEMLKVPNMQGQTTVHSAALKGHTDVLMAILKYVSNAQIYDLLMSQMDSGGYIARAFPDELGRYAKNSGKMFAKMAQCSSSDFEPSATFEQETQVPDHSRTGIRQSEEYAHGRGIECLNCKDLEEEVQQLRFHQNSLNVQQNERELLIEDQAAEIKQLTNQTRVLNILNSKLTYQMVTQSRHVEELTVKAEELSKKVVDQHRKLTDAKEENELLNNKICELEVKVEGNEEGNTSEADNGGAMAADPNSDIEEVYSESSDEEYYPIDPGLISSLKMFCQDLPMQNCRVLQNPHIWEVITVLGTDAKTKLSGKLEDFHVQNPEFKDKGYRVEVLDRKGEDHSSQLSLKFHTSTETNSTCELIVQEQQQSRRLFAVGPAHMLFCDSANEEFKTEKCDIGRIRRDIHQSNPAHSTCPIRHQTRLIRSMRDMKVKAGDNLEVNGNQTPYIAYRYKYKTENTPLTPDHHKHYTNDCVLFECAQSKVRHVQNSVRSAPWINKDIRNLSMNALQAVHMSGQKIMVKHYKGRLHNVGDLQDRIKNCEGIHLTFVVTSKLENGQFCKLTSGDSGSIVYYVGEETTKDGRKIKTYEPWGMLIESTEMGEGYTVYSAIVLHQAFRDIEADYGDLGQIDLFRPPNQAVQPRGPQPAN